MSTGNGGAAIGLANSEKRLPIGGLVADLVLPTAGVDYLGDNPGTYYSSNWLGEDAGFTVPSCNAGKNLIWATNTAQMTVAVDSKMAVTAGGVATASPGGAFQSYFTPGVIVPANSWFWAYQL